MRSRPDTAQMSWLNWREDRCRGVQPCRVQDFELLVMFVQTAGPTAQSIQVSSKRNLSARTGLSLCANSCKGQVRTNWHKHRLHAHVCPELASPLPFAVDLTRRVGLVSAGRLQGVQLCRIHGFEPMVTSAQTGGPNFYKADLQLRP